MQIDSGLLQSALQIIIVVVVPVLASLIAALLNYGIQWVRVKMTEKQLEIAENLIKGFVSAAEQYGLSDKLLAAGQKKKDWVVQRVDAELQKRGISIDVALLGDMVETAVFEGFNKPFPLPLPEIESE